MSPKLLSLCGFSLLFSLAAVGCIGDKGADTSTTEDDGAGDDGADDGADDGTDGADDGADGGEGTDDGTDGSDGTTEDDTGGSDGSDGTEEVPMISATLRGHVYVELYRTNEEGLRENVTFEEATGSTFPFGSIFVAGYEDNSGSETYRGNTAIRSPTVAGDTYELTVSMPEDGSGFVNVYASLDYSHDGIVHSYDPIGAYPDDVVVTDGAEVNDIDITILAPWEDGGGGDGGDGGGGTCTEISINGPVTLDEGSAATTSGAVMLFETDGSGPFDWAWFTPDGSLAGSYELLTCENEGSANLLGAVDSNDNGLIDPSDIWGAYVTAPDTSGNPISIDTQDLNNYEVQIPLAGAEDEMSIVPFITISGDVSMEDGSTFDSLPAGTTIYVVALKYAPNNDIAASSLETGSYDMAELAWADLTGQASIPYSFAVPANTVLYLWAYADVDGDGVVNEETEPVALSGSDVNGRLDIGSVSLIKNLPIDYRE